MRRHKSNLKAMVEPLTPLTAFEHFMTNWYEIEWPDLPRGTIVCDATATTAPMWGGPMLSILEDLAGIPEALQPEAVYLGDDVSCSLAEMLAAGTEFGDQAPDLNRGAVLGPWLARQAPKPTIVVAMSGTVILDLDDWKSPEWIERLAFYRFLGDDRLSPPPFTEWGPEIPLEELKHFLTDAVKEMTISGTGGVFLDWSEGELGRTPDLLLVTQPKERVRFSFHHVDGIVPTADLIRRSGERVPALVRAIAPPNDVESRGIAGVDNLLSLWSRGMAWACKLCDRSHPPGQALCTASDGSLFADLERDRLWNFRKHRDHWTAELAPRGVAMLDDGSTVLLTPAGTTMMDAEGIRHPLSTYFQRTADGGYLVRT